jgi:cyclophilin family peptidyl-prolyl cis-trans isomerase
VPAPEREGLYNTPPEPTVFKAGVNYQATVKTPKGDIVIQLNTKSAPQAVGNFVMLADLGFYDAMPVAFVDPELYMVSGSPASSPESDIGYALKPEGTLEESTIITGTVAMYPSFDQVTGEVKASGSQFFISLIAVADNQTPLSVLGQVISGLSIVTTLTMSDTLTTVTVTEK